MVVAVVGRFDIHTLNQHHQKSLPNLTLRDWPVRDLESGVPGYLLVYYTFLP